MLSSLEVLPELFTYFNYFGVCQIDIAEAERNKYMKSIG